MLILLIILKRIMRTIFFFFVCQKFLKSQFLCNASQKSIIIRNIVFCLIFKCGIKISQ